MQAVYVNFKYGKMRCATRTLSNFFCFGYSRRQVDANRYERPCISWKMLLQAVFRLRRGYRDKYFVRTATSSGAGRDYYQTGGSGKPLKDHLHYNRQGNRFGPG